MCALLFWLAVLSVRGSAAVETVNISLRVTTIIKPPFVMLDNATGEWSGYSIDLLEEIRKRHHFDYSISEVSDKEYGHTDENGKWTGMVARLMDKRADVAIGGLSFSVERARAIDFTIPVYDLVGISVVMRKPRAQRSLLTFLAVLETRVWALVVGSYFCTSLLIHLFDKYSPYSRRNSGDENREFDLKESLWFCASSLTSPGEAPRNLSGQLVAATWWLFGFITVATYTANAAVSITLPRLQRAVASLDDLGRQYAISYAPVRDSPEYRYFRRMADIEEKLHRIWMDMSMDDDLSPLERSKLAVWDFPLSSKYTDMFSTMTRAGNQCPESFQVGVDRVRRSQRYKVEDTSSEEFALIAEGSDVKYLTMTDCELMQLGEEFSKKPYAIGLQKNSPLKKIFDDAIYRLQDDNKLEKLKRKWWNENPNRKYCADEDDEPNYGMDIRDIGGVFIAVLAGIVVAYVILIYEYYRYRVPAIQRNSIDREIAEELAPKFRAAPTRNLDLG